MSAGTINSYLADVPPRVGAEGKPDTVGITGGVYVNTPEVSLYARPPLPEAVASGPTARSSNAIALLLSSVELSHQLFDLNVSEG